MPTKQEYRQRLVAKLQELFLLDQPDLDFGFYRIMHAKAKEITQFLEHDLLDIIEEAFGQEDENRLAGLQAEVDREIRNAVDYGADPENSPKVKEARVRYETALDNVGAEASIYDHLYRFFERYYDKGDFISRRYYTRETASKAAPFAVPYNGEEVMLHWANADQYYIKTAEYFNNATFDLSQAPEVQKAQAEQFDLGEDSVPTRIHFHIVEGTEGAHGNVKASENETRYFIIHHEQPVTRNEQDELVIQFEYRPDPEKSGQEGPWRARRAAEAVETVLDALPDLDGGEGYLKLLQTPAPTEKDAKRPLLAKYVNRYTSRNTHDYFIHKDLEGFLRRELDFYIKNEVMRLDDIENADAPAVESYLSRIRVLRRIAGQIITFLAQLEEFQKKLWLKKKFVVEANYCITLDRVPEEFYAEIAANDAQREEWVQLYAIDEIEVSTVGPGYSEPLAIEFLRANPYMMFDTGFFDPNFKAKLLSVLEDLDEKCSGVLVHAENFQALRLVHDRYYEQVQCIHIDPPYNTETSGFAYKNAFKHSSWVAMMFDRVRQAQSLMSTDGVFFCHIDHNEYENLFHIFDTLPLVNQGTIVWDKRNPAPGSSTIARQHEYITAYSKTLVKLRLKKTNGEAILDKAKELIQQYGGVNEQSRKGFKTWLRKQSEFTGGEKAYSEIDDDGRVFQSVHLGASEQRTDPKYFIPFVHPVTLKPCPVPSRGWTGEPGFMQSLLDNNEIIFGPDENNQPRRKYFLEDSLASEFTSVIQSAEKGKTTVDALGVMFPYCHPVGLYEDLDWSGTQDKIGYVLDFFAGSGTNGHAVINLNREDGGQRKYILVEMGRHFDTVLKPRVQKVVYSADWRDGKPQTRDTGVSQCFKVLRLESYEDTLNNLIIDGNPTRQQLLSANDDLRRAYMLGYMLDVETRSSASLLNTDAFADPTRYILKAKKPGSDEYTLRSVDLVETFNYLIGLRVEHIAAPQTFTASFKRDPDPELPGEQHTRLVLDGRMRQDEDGPWWFRKVEGWVPTNPMQPNNGQRDKVLIVWRKLTGDLEQDNLMLDEWFRHNRISTRDFEFDTIYVNGSNNLPNLRQEGETWKVRLLEEEFMQRMWDGDGA